MDRPPGVIPDVTPTQTQGPDYGLHVLQAVMEMQRSLGGIDAKINQLRTDVDGMGTKVEATNTKVDKINTKLVWVAGICSGITAIVIVVWAIVTQVPWDRLLNQPAAAPTVQAAAPAQSQPQTK